MTDVAPAASSHARPSAEEVDAVMQAAQLLVALTARSVAAVEPEISLAQLRVLVILDSRGPQSLGAMARHLDVHPSNATRACDRLVQGGLLTRNENPSDRRQIRLELTSTGRRVIESVMSHRRRQVEDLLAQMTGEQRVALVPMLRAMTAAGRETLHQSAWLSERAI
jgi:DNA-binding MarR family transcriptional regulator